MKKGGDSSSRNGAASPMVRWGLVVLALFGALALFLWVRGEVGSEGANDEGDAYGFSGDVYRFGQADHEIFFGKTVNPAVVESLGDYLEQVGYFSPAYGGVIQILSRGGGFDVYLTYSRQYWDRADFRDEVNSIREDLEANVLKASTRIILVDEDDEGIHSMNLNPKGDD